MIAMVYEEPQAQRLYDAEDLPWIGEVLDVVERALGEPWRVVVERVERAAIAVHSSDRTAMLQAVRRALGNGVQRARIAGQARGVVLGPPVLDPAARRLRLDAAAATNDTTAATIDTTAATIDTAAATFDGAAATAGDVRDDLESVSRFDLASERRLAFPDGRPTAAEVAAFANLERIQRWVRRAHDVQLRVWDGAHELVRTAARHGLIAQIRTDGDSTQLDVLGPLALFHSTIVYGRALAALVPRLAAHPRFELDIRCRLRGEDTRVRVTPPVMLPPAQVSPRRAPSVADRLARDLAELGHTVEREPAPIASGPHLLFPDLALEHAGTRWLIEVLGFSTPQSIAAKLDHYRDAGAAAMLCVDLTTAPGCELAARVCGFTRHVDVDDLFAALEAGP